MPILRLANINTSLSLSPSLSLSLSLSVFLYIYIYICNCEILCNVLFRLIFIYLFVLSQHFWSMHSLASFRLSKILKWFHFFNKDLLVLSKLLDDMSFGNSHINNSFYILMQKTFFAIFQVMKISLNIIKLWKWRKVKLWGYFRASSIIIIIFFFFLHF